MEAVRQIHECTERLYTHLQQGLPKENRKEYISVIQQLLEERQLLIDRLPPTFKDNSYTGAEEMLAYDQAIQNMLAEMFQEIRDNVYRFRKRKATSEKYVHPFRGACIDGVFLDKRK